MAERLYVYYTLPADALPAAVAAVRALQADLMHRFPGLHAELLCRSEARPDGRLTLMETYAGIADLPALREALAAAAPRLPLPRHEELFAPLA